MKRRYYATLLVVSMLGAVAVGAACSNQGEGEVCSIANGSDDCQTDLNLACYDYRQLNNTTSDRCCPLDRSKATHPTCLTPIAISGADPDGQAPADTGPSTTTTVTQDAQVADAQDGSQQ